MTELVTYGSVGGVGRKPGPYPAADGEIARVSVLTSRAAAGHLVVRFEAVL